MSSQRRTSRRYFQFGTSFYTYDRPKTNLDINLQYYPSLSDTGRQRVQLDAGGKRELWKDLFVALNLVQHVRQPASEPGGQYQRRRHRAVDRLDVLDCGGPPGWRYPR